MAKKTIFLEKHEKADNFLKRLRGLMFRKRIKKPLVFYLPRETKNSASIHMLFVFFPIDVAYLDSQKTIVDIYENLAPFSLGVTPKKKAKYIIEAEKGFIEKKKLKIGDKIQF